MKHSWLRGFAISAMLLSVAALSACLTEVTSRSIAIEGDTAVIGNLGERAAFVFVRGSDSAWREQATLRSDNVRSLFGSAVALSGDTAALGAYYLDEQGNPYDSVIYVFSRDSQGSWNQQAILRADDGEADDGFGATLVLSGDVAVVGDPWSDDNGDDSGAVYVFRRDHHGRWRQEAKLLARDGAYDDRFGSAVALFGNTLVIGADMDDVGGEEDAGSVYIFVRSPNGHWRQRAKLHSGGGASGDWFGSSLALFGNTLAVGAVNDDERGVDSGAVYIFTRDKSGRWNMDQKLMASDAVIRGGFGKEVALFGDKLVIGTERSTRASSPYLFARDDAGHWSKQGKIQGCEGVLKKGADYSVSLYGNTALLVGDGCFAFTSTDAQREGTTYMIYDKASGNWRESAQPPVEQQNE